MSGIGVPGIILLLILALLLFGPNKLPELGRAFGRTLREFKAGARDIMGDGDETNSSNNRKDITPVASSPVQTPTPQVSQTAVPQPAPTTEVVTPVEPSRRLPE
ncbi:twin-arginine translocase TatA/TatE family subunit [Paenibacillus taiwanensis]|uniref:twin-arginine translocase TatA/TatE family subunit n=1 Tax=Paenibacillus taiwanensis TaxID=401638 RepID=UPI00040BA9AB|nr:twin-arginine translocase TatA/TatE family subunit [Paenibacillus taiwanensis]